jgi:hypothetical protein
MMTQNQLELELAAANRPPLKQEARSNRASWWFKQMRQVVDQAFEWEPAPRFRPEQILFTENASRG